MPFSLVPRHSFRLVTDISPDFLEALGIKFLMLDLDNTIAAYGQHAPSEVFSLWAKSLEGRGITLYIVSNSVRKERVEAFASLLNIGFVMAARKPSPAGVQTALEATNFGSSESALVGDQIFTDTLAANRAEVISIIVKPVRFTNVFLALRYAAEAPFRAACRGKKRAVPSGDR